jgi:hypothetical protein
MSQKMHASGAAGLFPRIDLHEGYRADVRTPNELSAIGDVDDHVGSGGVAILAPRRLHQVKQPSVGTSGDAGVGRVLAGAILAETPCSR